MKNVDAGSVTAYNLFWNNAADMQGSNVDSNTSLFADPMLDVNIQLQQSSPAIDAGAAHFVWQGETVLDIPPDAFSGTAPDLGAYESNSSQASRRPCASLRSECL
jgi:hypothetical protein